MSTTDSVLVGFDHKDDGTDHAVLIVGRKRKNQSVEIINAFEGAEAIELWEKLTTKKEKNDVRSTEH